MIHFESCEINFSFRELHSEILQTDKSKKILGDSFTGDKLYRMLGIIYAGA